MLAVHAPESGTHYLTADHPLGPWTLGPMPFLDGSPDCARYAGRILHHRGRDLFIAFDNGPGDRFPGTLCDPLPVSVLPDGRLTLQGDKP